MTNTNLKPTQHAHDSRNGHTIDRFVELLEENNNAGKLRHYADALVENGVPVHSVCSKSYDYMERMITHNSRRAKRITREMSGEPYHWECWLK